MTSRRLVGLGLAIAVALAIAPTVPAPAQTRLIMAFVPSGEARTMSRWLVDRLASLPRAK